MELIPEGLVEETWQEFADFSPVRAQKETIKVSKNQPNLLTFMIEFTQDLDLEVRELAIYMFYVVCRMFQKAQQRKLKESRLRKSSIAMKKMSVLWKAWKGPTINFLKG